jgi:hypothetical protein
MTVALGTSAAAAATTCNDAMIASAAFPIIRKFKELDDKQDKIVKRLSYLEQKMAEQHEQLNNNDSKEHDNKEK